MAGGIMLEVDASDVLSELHRLEGVLKPEQIDRCMYRIFMRTGKHVRAVLKKDLPMEYEIKAGEVGAAVRNGRATFGGGGAGCTIPVVGPRRTIGGGFKAAGGAHGWASVKRKYRVKARIVKSGQSILPPNVPSYGGNPPFRNYDAPSLNGVAFTRKTMKRLPIQKVEGIAIPQMPMNRSEEDVQNDIREYMEKRMEHEIQAMIAGH